MNYEKLCEEYDFCATFMEREDSLEVILDEYVKKDIPVHKKFDTSVMDGMSEDEYREYVNNLIENDPEKMTLINEDSRIVWSIDLMECIIIRLWKEDGMNQDTLKSIRSAAMIVAEKEKQSEYYSFGENMSSLAANATE